MTAPEMQTALAHRKPLSAPDKAVEMAEAPLAGKLILRLDAAIAPFDLPGPCAFVTDKRTDILWLGPDEWMFVTPLEDARERLAALKEACAGLHHQLVDVSDYYTTIRLAGPRAAETLMKLTTLDLHPRAFAPGSVAGTNFAKTAAWLLRRKEHWEIIVRWSMADYLWSMLAGAAREFGLPDQPPAHLGKGLRYKP